MCLYSNILICTCVKFFYMCSKSVLSQVLPTNIISVSKLHFQCTRGEFERCKSCYHNSQFILSHIAELFRTRSAVLRTPPLFSIANYCKMSSAAKPNRGKVHSVSLWESHFNERTDKVKKRFFVVKTQKQCSCKESKNTKL